MHRRFLTIVLVLGVLAASAAVAVAASSPAVSTGSAKSITQTGATLTGTVNPNGSATSYIFEWGLAKNTYGALGHVHSAGNGTKSVAAKATPTGLIPGTVYHYRLVATNRYGTSTGSDRTFKTSGHPPPGATTGPASGVTTSAITLTGVISPNGATTTWEFQYGTSANYSSQTNLGSVAAGSAAQTVSYAVTGLAPGTVFHYRLVAFHSVGPTSYGADEIFMTEPSPAPTPRVTTDTRPRFAHAKPFVLRTKGRVIGPSAILPQFDCSGQVAVRYLLGKRTLAYFLAPVQPDCTYSAQMVFNHKPGHGAKNRRVKLVIAIRFHGNGYLTPAQGHYVAVILG